VLKQVRPGVYSDVVRFQLISPRDDALINAIKAAQEAGMKNGPTYREIMRNGVLNDAEYEEHVVGYDSSEEGFDL